MEEGERVRRGSSFGAAAAAYSEHRPDYADAAVRWALEPAPGSRVLDIGAGTGKLTAALLALGADVIAVEPDPSMLAELRSLLPSARAMEGSAESLALPDGSVDAVVGGQALHWFDMAVAGPEIARVLAPGGILAGLWNLYDDRIDWVAGFDRITEGAAGATFSDWQGEERDAHLSAIDLPELFGLAERAEFRHGQQRTSDSLLATIATHSELLVMSDDKRTDLLSRIRAYLEGHPQTASGEFTLPLVTGVLRARRL